jgi:hypothetical protein
LVSGATNSIATSMMIQSLLFNYNVFVAPLTRNSSHKIGRIWVICYLYKGNLKGMKKIILFVALCFGLVLYSSQAQAQDDGGGKKSKKSKKDKNGGGTQEDIDQDMKEGKERGMSKQDKKNLAKKKKEVAAKRKNDEITRKRSDKIARKRLDKTKKSASKKKKNWVKTH